MYTPLRFLRTIVPIMIVVMPALVLAAAPRTFRELACEIADLIDTATFTLIIFALVAYFWGLATNIPHFGDEKGAEKRKSFFFWGLIIIFVMVSIWGIVQLLQNTLGVQDPSGSGANVCST